MQRRPAVVLGDHLLDKHRRMTLITFRDGTVVMRGDKVGTGPECCFTCACNIDSFKASGLTPRLDLTFTMPQHPPCPPFPGPPNCDCPAGVYQLQLDIDQDAGFQLEKCVAFDMDGIDMGCLAEFFCDGCDYLVRVQIGSWFACVPRPPWANFNCTFGNGLYISTSALLEDCLRFDSRLVGDLCLPYAKAHSFVCRFTGVEFNYTVNFV